MQVLNQSTNSFTSIALGVSEGKVGALSERNELVKFFVDNLKNKNGKSFPARMIAVKLSHLTSKDLYNFISQCKDVKNRKGQDSFQKFFWWSLKSK